MIIPPLEIPSVCRAQRKVWKYEYDNGITEGVELPEDVGIPRVNGNHEPSPEKSENTVRAINTCDLLVIRYPVGIIIDKETEAADVETRKLLTTHQVQSPEVKQKEGGRRPVSVKDTIS